MTRSRSHQERTGRHETSSDDVQAAVAFDRYRSLARLRHRMQADFWLDLDVSLAHLRVLSLVAAVPRISVSELARRLRASLPAASQAVDRLVSSGHLERMADPTDRRRTFLELTPAGVTVSDASLGLMEPVRRWLGQLSPDDLAAATQGFESLLRAAEAELLPDDSVPR
jgi:DNA-binding MarR family transcriptional regulator